MTIFLYHKLPHIVSAKCVYFFEILRSSVHWLPFKTVDLHSISSPWCYRKFRFVFSIHICIFSLLSSLGNVAFCYTTGDCYIIITIQTLLLWIALNSKFSLMKVSMFWPMAHGNSSSWVSLYWNVVMYIMYVGHIYVHIYLHMKQCSVQSVLVHVTFYNENI